MFYKKSLFVVKNKSVFGRGALILAALLWISGCKPPTPNSFRDETSLKNGQWLSETKPLFELNIEDTSAHYQTYILLRNDDSYPFSNIWLRMSMKQPGDTTTAASSERINLKLADISGAWLGKNMGSIYEHKIPLSKKEDLNFPKPGTYQISLEQIMREDPLPGILNIGILVEKRK